MEQDSNITTEHVLHLMRSRRIPSIPLEAIAIESTPAPRIVETFRARVSKACDAGVWKRLSNFVLDPANPFDAKARRQLRLEALVIGTLVFTALGLAVYFNVTAMAR